MTADAVNLRWHASYSAMTAEGYLLRREVCDFGDGGVSRLTVGVDPAIDGHCRPVATSSPSNPGKSCPNACEPLLSSPCICRPCGTPADEPEPPAPHTARQGHDVTGPGAATVGDLTAPVRNDPAYRLSVMIATGIGLHIPPKGWHRQLRRRWRNQAGHRVGRRGLLITTGACHPSRLRHHRAATYTPALIRTKTTANAASIQPNMTRALRPCSSATIAAITAIQMPAINIATAPPPCGITPEENRVPKNAVTGINHGRATAWAPT
jgi:hypothetical protein